MAGLLDLDEEPAIDAPIDAGPKPEVVQHRKKR